MGNSRSFGAQAPDIEHLQRGTGGLAGEVADLRGDADEGFTAMEAEVSGAAVAQASILMSTNPTAADTLTLGGDVYEFVTTLGDETAPNKGIVIQGSAALTLTLLVDAINRGATAVIGTNVSDHGDTKVVASEYNTTFLHVEWSNRPGGAPSAGARPNVVLADTLTAAVEWEQNNLNLTGGNNGLKKTVHQLTVDADNLLADFDLSASGIVVSTQVLYVTDAAGVVDTTGKGASIALTVNASLNSVTVGLDDGATDPVATDEVFVEIVHN